MYKFYYKIQFLTIKHELQKMTNNNKIQRWTHKCRYTVGVNQSSVYSQNNIKLLNVNSKMSSK